MYVLPIHIATCVQFIPSSSPGLLAFRAVLIPAAMSLGLGGLSHLAARRTAVPCGCSLKVRDPLFQCISKPVQRQQQARRSTPTCFRTLCTPAGRKTRQVSVSSLCRALITLNNLFCNCAARAGGLPGKRCKHFTPGTDKFS